MQSTSAVRATVNPAILDKVDRLFRNDDYGVWVELLQNARRAGATAVEVSISETDAAVGECQITIQDDGRGIDDFQHLLTLGASGWSADTQQREDPAGMGFFALCRSVVEVHSGNHVAQITPAVFLGKDETQVRTTDDFVRGTRLRFTRASTKDALEKALIRVAEFCSLDVQLEGNALTRHDFLAGAHYRETIDGIEIGFSTEFAYGVEYFDLNWNFYGARIHHQFDSIPGLLGASGDGELAALRARFNVLETARVKLQLPDRRAIIQDQFLVEFVRKARAAAYRYFQMQEQHVLPFNNWKEAKALGVELPEAAQLLTTWHAQPQDEFVEPVFGPPERLLLPDISGVVLVDSDLPDAHTLEGALHTGATFDRALYNKSHQFEGYSWYDALPRLVKSAVFIDKIPWAEWARGTRPETIMIELTIEQNGRSENLRLPALIHVQSEDTYDACFVAVQNSPWDNNELQGPFSVIDFLLAATFCASDDSDSDSWATQKHDHYEGIERDVNSYFRGPEASLVAILRKTIDWNANELADQIGLIEFRFKRTGSGTRDWNIELVTAAAAPPQVASS